MNRILVVDDEAAVRFALTETLKKNGFTPLEASGGAEAIKAVWASKPDLILLDLVMPELGGMETLAELKKIDQDLPVIMVTGHGDIATAVRAVKLGAHDFIEKPFQPRILILTIQRALERSELQRSVRQIEASLESIFGKSDRVRGAILKMRQAAWGDLPMVIQGERGTGKSMAAQVVHNLSRRAGQPFQVVETDLVSAPLIEGELFAPQSGAFDLARGGTVFINGVKAISLAVQEKLLKAIDEGKVYPALGAKAREIDVRVIAATDTGIETLMEEKRLLEGLGARLGRSVIALPPLRERMEDVPFLANKFLREAALDMGRPVRELGRDALDVLMRHSWPGNARELENVVRRALLLSGDGAVQAEHLLPAIAAAHEARGTASFRLRDGARAGEGAGQGSAERDLAREALRESEERYRQVVDLSPSGIFIQVEGKVVYANPSFVRMVGAGTPEELYGKPSLDFAHPDERALVEERRRSVVVDGKETPIMERKFLRLDGSVINTETRGFPFIHRGQKAIMVVAEDVTQRKRAEETLTKREKELEDKSSNLEQANAALKVLLKHRDEDRGALEQTILANVKELVFPYIEKMRGSQLTDNQLTYLDIIESNLSHIISPFLQKLSALFARFTPTEVQVADMIRSGKTSKEIADLLHVSKGTVDGHRNNIRSKLGLSNKKTNLQTYLLSL